MRHSLNYYEHLKVLIKEFNEKKPTALGDIVRLDMHYDEGIEVVIVLYRADRYVGKFHMSKTSDRKRIEHILDSILYKEIL